MKPTTIYKYLTVVSFVLCFFDGHSKNKDTTIITRWRDGSKKTATICKLQRTKDKNGSTVTVLKKIKDVKYYKPACEERYDEEWKELEKCEVPKDEYRVFYTIYNEQDSLDDVMRKGSKRNKRNTFRLNVGFQNSRLNFPINIDVGDTNTYSWKKQDTTILGKTYSHQIFTKDPDFRFSAAFRVDAFKIYSFNPNTQTDELKIDIEAVAKQTGQKIMDSTEAFMRVFPKPDGSLVEAVKSGATKGLAIVLANLVLIQK